MTPAYLAGFFDGEGCVGVYLRNQDKSKSHKYYVLVVSLSQVGDSGRDLLRSIQDEYGGSVYKNTSGVWYYTLSANKARAFLLDILPFLVIKQTQAALGLSFQDEQDKTTNNVTATNIANELKDLKKRHLKEI